MVVKPLGLPVGSVRAALLLALAARAILDLRATGQLASWLVGAIVICAASYFSARSATNAHKHVVPGDGGASKKRHPLGLPAGTVRVLFLVALGYGAWLWFDNDESRSAELSLLWIVGAFVVGIVMRLILTRFRPEDAGARFADHLLALISILAAAGLVAIAAMGTEADVSSWSQPMLAAIVVHYFATR